jgi:hypothetical protein
MVPQSNQMHIIYKSILKTLSNLTQELIILCNEKQKCILSQDWDNLKSIAEKQLEINKSFDHEISKIIKYDFNNESNKEQFKQDKEIRLFKNNLKNKINQYKETENLNKRLLKDAFFVAKQKVDKILNNNPTNEIYTKNKPKDIWGDKPIMLDKLI